VSGLTHLDAQGRAHMVDVSEKAPTTREATAEAVIEMAPATLALLREGAPKGDVLAVARIAAIQATKETSRLIPLCHPLPLSKVSVSLEAEEAGPTGAQVRVQVTARCTGPTGVEMEALTGASVGALTLYDMLKAVDRGMRFTTQLLSKSGGRSGEWRRGPG